MGRQHSHLVVVGLAAAPTGRAARDARVDDHVMIARLVIAHVCEYSHRCRRQLPQQRTDSSTRSTSQPFSPAH